MAAFNKDEIRFIKEHGIFLGIRAAASKKRDPLLAGLDRVYGIVSLDRRNAAKAPALVAAAIKNGYPQVKLELCGKGRWSAKELEGLRAGLRGVGDLLLKSVIAKKEFFLLNLEELADAADGCKIFANMLMADAKGNYLLTPPHWRYEGSGVKLGHVDTGIKAYQNCVYDAASAECTACEKKNFALLAKLYDGSATAEFGAGLAKIYEGAKYLGKSKPVFKAYMARLLKNKDRESGLFINEGAAKA